MPTFLHLLPLSSTRLHRSWWIACLVVMLFLPLPALARKKEPPNTLPALPLGQPTNTTDNTHNSTTAPQKETNEVWIPLHRLEPTPSTPSIEAPASAEANDTFTPYDTLPPEWNQGQQLLDIQCDRLDYQSEHKVYVALGNVRVVGNDPNSQAFADKMTFHPEKNIVIAEGNVRLLNSGLETRGIYARIDLTHSQGLITTPVTNQGYIKIKSKEGFVSPQLVHLTQGSMTIDKSQLSQGVRFGRTRPVAGDASRGNVIQLGVEPILNPSQRTMVFEDADADVNTEAIELNNVLAYYQNYDEAAYKQIDADYNSDTGRNSDLRLEAKRVDVVQYGDGFQKATVVDPWLSRNYKRWLPLPNLDIAVNNTTKQYQYLGPTFGFNRELGGAFFQPGWDAKVGSSSLTLSPLVSYGQTIQRYKRSIDVSSGAEFNLGVFSEYRTKRFHGLFARNFGNNYSVAEGQYRLWKGGSAIFGHNARLNTNLFLQERPRDAYALNNITSRKLGNLFYMVAQQNVGIFRDEFFPFNSSTQLVTPLAGDPNWRGRAQSQILIQNQQPLLQLGSLLELGAMARITSSYYFDGNYQSIIQAGPTANLFLGDRFMAQAFYATGPVSGDSPFVFDSFYQGKETLQTNYTFRLNQFLRMGVMQMYNLRPELANADKLIQNLFYVTAGPKNLKFTLFYDTLFRTTQFGLSYYPSYANTELLFEQANIFRPIPGKTKRQQAFEAGEVQPPPPATQANQTTKPTHRGWFPPRRLVSTPSAGTTMNEPLLATPALAMPPALLK
ncbi:MAG: hypothetical protein ACKO34_08665 [Vampirovibrionales bacterium]